jgi:hypothetical protein
MHPRRLIVTMYVFSVIGIALMAYATQGLWLGTELWFSFVGSHQAVLASDAFLAISLLLFIFVLLVFRNRAANLAISLPSIVLGVAPFLFERWAFTTWILGGFR